MRANSAGWEETSPPSLFSSCPVLLKYGLKYKFYPQEKRIRFSKPFSEGSPKQKKKNKKQTNHLWLQGLNQIDYILCSQRWTSSIQSAKTRPGVDCGSDHELLMAKFRLKLKKVGKTTRPFRYDLKQIANNYTVEVRNRFKGLDLIDRVPAELWTEVHYIVQETGSKAIPKKKKCKKAKWLS